MKDQTNDIINSLDGMQRAEAPGFFYAGIRAKMEREQKSRFSFSWRPAYVTAVLVIFLAANISVLAGMNKKEQPGTATQPGISSFSQEYHLNVQTLVQ